MAQGHQKCEKLGIRKNSVKEKHIKIPNDSSHRFQHLFSLQAELLMPTIIDSLKSGITSYSAHFPEYNGELKITFLITWDAKVK